MITGENLICLDFSYRLLGLIIAVMNVCTHSIYNSHLPEFTVEVPEEAEAETIEVQKILLLEMRGILHKQIDNCLNTTTDKQ